MVYGRKDYRYWGYKPTYNWGGTILQGLSSYKPTYNWGGTILQGLSNLGRFVLADDGLKHGLFGNPPFSSKIFPAN